MAVKSLRIDFFKVLGFLFLGVILFLIIFFLFLPNYTKIKELREEYNILSKSIEETKKEIETLKIQIGSWDKDPFYLEKVARENLGLLKENEVAVKIEE